MNDISIQDGNVSTKMVNILVEVNRVKSAQESNVLKTLTDACVKGYTYDCNAPA